MYVLDLKEQHFSWNVVEQKYDRMEILKYKYVKTVFKWLVTLHHWLLTIY